LNCTHAPGSARHMPADVSPSCRLSGLSPGLLCLPEGGGAPSGASIIGAPLAKGPRPPLGRRAFRRSTAAICYAATALLGLDRRLSPHVIRAALAPPFIQTRPAIEGRPLIGVGQ
jgi:hypothetical protein